MVEELIALGARRLVRVGTCGALVELELGSLVIAETVHARDGASLALGASGPLAADPALLAALNAAGKRRDDRHRPVRRPLLRRGRVGRGRCRVDLTAGAVFAVAARHGVAAACVLSVSDVLVGERRRIEPEALEHAEVELGRVGAAALS